MLAQFTALPVPLPSSALMILALMGGCGMVVRSPSHKNRTRRRR